MRSIQVMFLASEADPFIKIGGLGDVAGSLPAALTALRADIKLRLFLPRHKQIDLSPYTIKNTKNIQVTAKGQLISADVLLLDRDDVEIYFIDAKPILENEKVYSPDILQDAEKYLFFITAAMQFVRQENWRPDILFANDWHTALALHLAKNHDLDGFWKQTKRIIAIHNLAYMGAGSEPVLSAYGIEPIVTDEIPWWGKHFPLPMGAVAADKIVTVSPTYAKEIQTEEFGCGMQDFFTARQKDIIGIVNGIDLAAWNPATDKHIVKQYDLATISTKAKDKLDIQKEAGLPQDAKVPLMAIVTRMDHQKGVDLLIKAVQSLQNKHYQLIILGTGNPELEAACKGLEFEYPDQVRALIRFDGALSRRIYAGADVILMPSRYEPCGIAQMISMRYGSVPLARSTGGLRDTIQDGKTGFLFEKIDGIELGNCILRALAQFEDHKAWAKIQALCMAQDFSWERSAKVYHQVFVDLLKE